MSVERKYFNKIKELEESLEVAIDGWNDQIAYSLELLDKNESFFNQLNGLKKLAQKRKHDNSDIIRKNIQLKGELDNLVMNERSGHIPQLAFKNGKAYCKICGYGLE